MNDAEANANVRNHPLNLPTGRQDFGLMQ